MSATDIDRTWDGIPLWCTETQRELVAIARIQASAYPQAAPSNAQAEGEALHVWADDGGAIA